MGEIDDMLNSKYDVSPQILRYVVNSFFLIMQIVTNFDPPKKFKKKTPETTATTLKLTVYVCVFSPGGRIIMACRNTEKGEQARQEVVEETGNEQVLVRELDLGSLESVQKFAKEFNESEAGIEN